MTIVDTSFLYALLDSRETDHARAAAWVQAADPELVTTPLILSEADHLARRRGGKHAVDRFRAEVADGALEVEWSPAIVAPMMQVAETYRGLDISLDDASLVALAAHLHTTKIATFDERHFRAMRPLTGEPAFTLLPADAPAG